MQVWPSAGRRTERALGRTANLLPRARRRAGLKPGPLALKAIPSAPAYRAMLCVALAALWGSLICSSYRRNGMSAVSSISRMYPIGHGLGCKGRRRGFIRRRPIKRNSAKAEGSQPASRERRQWHARQRRRLDLGGPRRAGQGQQPPPRGNRPPLQRNRNAAGRLGRSGPPRLITLLAPRSACAGARSA